MVEPDADKDPAGLGGPEQWLQFRGAPPRWFLDEHVTAGGYGSCGDLGERIVQCRDNDHIASRPLKELAPVAVANCTLDRCGKRCGARAQRRRRPPDGRQAAPTPASGL